MKTMIFTALLLIAGNALAEPECDYHLNVPTTTILVSEAPQVVQQDTLINRGQNSPDGRCRDYRLYFGKGQANSYQRKAFSATGRSLNYNLHPTVNKNGILKDFSDAVSANEFLGGQSPDKFTNYSNRFYISAPGAEDVTMAAGTYTDVVQVTAYGFKETGNNYLFETTQSTTLLFIVPKKIDVSLVDENGTFDRSSTSKVMDFGILSQGAERAADLRVVSNTPYQVKMSSFNNGTMKSPQNAGITYTLKVNGSTVSLAGSSGAPATVGGGNNTNAAGDRYNLRVQITGTTEGLPAGLYEDAITITAIAN